MSQTRVPALAWAAFAGMVVFAGANVVAVKISNEELAPFWGAFLRFFCASLLFFLFVAARRIALPRGRALVGAVVYGVLNFAISYAVLYTVLQEVSAGSLSVMMAVGPLLTLLLASAHGLERIHRRAVIGGLLALGGMVVLLQQQVDLAVPVTYLALAFLGVVIMSEAGVLVKYFPRPHPAALNAVGMGIGAVLLLGFSFLAREDHATPKTLRNLAALAYLVFLGSIGLFGLFLYAIARMDVSLIAYQFVLMPVVTVFLARLLVAETPTASFFLGGLVVAAGVFVAITGQPSPRPPARLAPITGDAGPQSGASGTDAPRP